SGEVTRAVGAGIIKGTLGSGEYDGWINGLAQERERKSCFLHRVGSVRDDDGMRPSAVTSQLVDISSGEGGGDERARIAHLNELGEGPYLCRLGEQLRAPAAHPPPCRCVDRGDRAARGEKNHHAPDGSPTGPVAGQSQDVKTYQTYLFDLDGTIYLGEELLPGAARTIAALKDTGADVRYVTNNPTRLATDYAAKLTGLGVPTHPDEVITSVTATTMWLRENHPEAAVYPIGEPPLLKALREGGVQLSSDPAEIDLVLVSFDRTFTYEKLQIAFDALWFHKRALLVATNPDKFCPYP